MPIYLTRDERRTHADDPNRMIARSHWNNCSYWSDNWNEIRTMAFPILPVSVCPICYHPLVEKMTYAEMLEKEEQRAYGIVKEGHPFDAEAWVEMIRELRGVCYGNTKTRAEIYSYWLAHHRLP